MTTSLQVALVGLFAGLLAFPAGAGEAGPGAADIARQALEAWPAGGWTLSAVLTTRAARRSGDNRNKPATTGAVVRMGEQPLTIRFTRLDDGSCQAVYRPANEADAAQGMRILLPSKRDGARAQIFELKDHVAVKDAQRLFLGSAFSLEDLALRFLSWKDQEWLGEETLKDRACWKIASRPSQGETTAYGRVESWVDREYRALLKSVAYDNEGYVAKEFNVRSFQQLENSWMLKTLELDAPILGARSRLEILETEKKE
ncbi:MAG: outer membrane lipoprotein-sorting protein [Verrucomicrobia bacterium]|nr:outer membrane lipoprotein-sorting protein [Verrucomicrobiota bacterium]